RCIEVIHSVEVRSHRRQWAFIQVGMKSRCLSGRPVASGAFMLNGMRNFAQTFRDRAAATSRPTRARNGAWLAGEQAIMGTAIRVELWSDDVANGEAAIAAVMQEMHRIDAAMSPFKADS